MSMFMEDACMHEWIAYALPLYMFYGREASSNQYQPQLRKNALLIPALGIELQEQVTDVYGAEKSPASLYVKSVPVVCRFASSIYSLSVCVSLPQITAVIARSPAERAGLFVGDQIVSIDGYDLVVVEKSVDMNYFASAQSAISLSEDGEDGSVPGRLGQKEKRPSGVLKIMKELFSVSDIRTRFNTAVPKHLKVKPKDLSPDRDTRFICFGKERSCVEEALSPWRDSDDAIKEVVLKPDFEYLDDKERISYDVLPASHSAEVDYLRIFSFDRTSSRELFRVLWQKNFLVSVKSLQSVGGLGDFVATGREGRERTLVRGMSPVVPSVRAAEPTHSSSTPSSRLSVEAEESMSKSREKRLLIIDLRNNYGGVIQDAMLAAALFLPDPHAMICHTVSGRAPVGNATAYLCLFIYA